MELIFQTTLFLFLTVSIFNLIVLEEYLSSKEYNLWIGWLIKPIIPFVGITCFYYWIRCMWELSKLI